MESWPSFLNVGASSVFFYPIFMVVVSFNYYFYFPCS